MSAGTEDSHLGNKRNHHPRTGFVGTVGNQSLPPNHNTVVRLNGKTRIADAKVIERGWWPRSKAGGRSRGKIHYTDPRMGQVSGSDRRRRAEENMGRYPRKGVTGRGWERMGPFCVCRRVDGTGPFRL